MILKEIFYGIKCDRCGTINNETDTAFWNDESTAENQANDDEWNSTIPGKHYCPNCFTVNEETEEVTIKPPFPESVKRIEKFIDTITKNCAEVHEKDDRFEIQFNERIAIGVPEQNWLTTSYPAITIERYPLRRGQKIIITVKK